MEKQELKEIIAEVKHSDMPEPTKKKIVNLLYEKKMERSEEKNRGGLMAKTVCKAVKTNEVPRRGKPSVEWHKEGKPQYYCYGWKDNMTDELLEVCRNCKDNVIYAQDDLDKWNDEQALKQIGE